MNKLVNKKELQNMRGNKGSSEVISGSLKSVSDVTNCAKTQMATKGRPWKP